MPSECAEQRGRRVQLEGVGGWEVGSGEGQRGDHRRRGNPSQRAPTAPPGPGLAAQSAQDRTPGTGVLRHGSDMVVVNCKVGLVAVWAGLKQGIIQGRDGRRGEARRGLLPAARMRVPV